MNFDSNFKWLGLSLPAIRQKMTQFVFGDTNIYHICFTLFLLVIVLLHFIFKLKRINQASDVVIQGLIDENRQADDDYVNLMINNRRDHEEYQRRLGIARSGNDGQLDAIEDMTNSLSSVRNQFNNSQSQIELLQDQLNESRLIIRRLERNANINQRNLQAQYNSIEYWRSRFHLIYRIANPIVENYEYEARVQANAHRNQHALNGNILSEDEIYEFLTRHPDYTHLLADTDNYLLLNSLVSLTVTSISTADTFVAINWSDWRSVHYDDGRHVLISKVSGFPHSTNFSFDHVLTPGLETFRVSVFNKIFVKVIRKIFGIVYTNFEVMLDTKEYRKIMVAASVASKSNEDYKQLLSVIGRHCGNIQYITPQDLAAIAMIIQAQDNFLFSKKLVLFGGYFEYSNDVSKNMYGSTTNMALTIFKYVVPATLISIASISCFMVLKKQLQQTFYVKDTFAFQNYCHNILDVRMKSRDELVMLAEILQKQKFGMVYNKTSNFIDSPKLAAWWPKGPVRLRPTWWDNLGKSSITPTYLVCGLACALVLTRTVSSIYQLVKKFLMDVYFDFLKSLQAPKSTFETAIRVMNKPATQAISLKGYQPLDTDNWIVQDFKTLANMSNLGLNTCLHKLTKCFDPTVEPTVYYFDPVFIPSPWMPVPEWLVLDNIKNYVSASITTNLKSLFLFGVAGFICAGIYLCSKYYIRDNVFEVRKIVGLCMPEEECAIKPGFKTDAKPFLCPVTKAAAFAYGPCDFKRLSFCASCPENILNAYRSRQAKLFDTKACESFVEYSRRFHYQFRKTFNLIDSRAWATRFTGGKAKRYLIALQKIQNGEPVNYKFKCFVKREILTKAEEHYQATVYNPRLITSSDDTFTAATGPIMYSIAQHVKQCWDGTHGIIYATGMNKTQLGHLYDECLQILNPQDCFLLISDLNRCDAHGNYYHLESELETDFYIMGHVQTDYATHFRKIYQRSGVLRSREDIFGATMAYTRHTGVNNTSDGNTRWCVTAHDIVLSHFFDPFDAREKRLLIEIVNGDNILMFVSKKLPMPIVKDYDKIMKKTGFDSTTKYVRYDQPDFCSCLFVPTLQGSLAVQYPGKSLIKAYASIHKYNDAQAKWWLRTVSMAAMIDFYPIPIVSGFHEAVHRLTKDARVQKLTDDLNEYTIYKHAEFKHQPNEATYLWFKARYNISDLTNPFSQCKSLNEIQFVLDTDCRVQMIISRDLIDEATILPPTVHIGPLLDPFKKNLTVFRDRYGQPFVFPDITKNESDISYKDFIKLHHQKENEEKQAFDYEVHNYNYQYNPYYQHHDHFYDHHYYEQKEEQKQSEQPFTDEYYANMLGLHMEPTPDLDTLSILQEIPSYFQPTNHQKL